MRVGSSFEARFGGVARLFGRAGAERLISAHVCVIGLGGVGSWAVEALARTGIGRLTLVDFDEVCISNVNRQLHAVTGEFGRPKVEAMTRRVALINPDCRVDAVAAFFTAANAEALLATPYHFVIDAIDRPSLKALLIARCRQQRLPVVTVGAAGGRRDGTAVRISDLARVTHDRLLQGVRKLLRAEHSFPAAPRRFQVDAVHSPERVVYPQADGSVCSERAAQTDLRLDCRSGYGTATFVTGAFGFAAAGYVVQHLVAGSKQS
jgi:tRNA A37 threonylcarbamoyladenosine dehydratase